MKIVIDVGEFEEWCCNTYGYNADEYDAQVWAPYLYPLFEEERSSRAFWKVEPPKSILDAYIDEHPEHLTGHFLWIEWDF